MPARPWKALAFAGLLTVFPATGCSLLGGVVRNELRHGETVTVPAFRVRPGVGTGTGIGGFLAGAETSDITPTPGFPTGGMGPAGNLARGYWSRLQARAVFLQDGDGANLVLVSCDLFAIPGALRDRVAAEMAARRQDVSILPDAIVLSATHTHHGPAGYLSAPGYNEHAGSYPGFSRDLFEFLVDRVADAIDGAVDQALAAGPPVRVSVHTGRMDHSLVRNRSPWSFLANLDAFPLMNRLGGRGSPPCRPEPGEPETFWDLEDCPRLRAVDRSFTVLEIERGPTVALVVFAAFHPTVLAADTPFYSADLSGYVTERVSRDLSREGRSPVVAFFNGAEGDLTPRRKLRDFRDLFTLGERMRAAVHDALARPGRPVVSPSASAEAPRIAVRASRNAAARLEFQDCRRGQTETRRLADVPQYGVAALGGAEGDHTILHDLGWHEGVRDRPLGGQGSKLPALDSPLLRFVQLTQSFAPPESFPKDLPVTVASIGDFLIATVPAEMTTAMGDRIRSALAADPSHDRAHAAIVGLTNEFVGYVTTPEEYAMQAYEGASTIWGPHEGTYLMCEILGLRAELADGNAPRGLSLGRKRYDVGKAPFEPFRPRFLGDPRDRPDAELEKLLRTSRTTPTRALPMFAWDEPVPPKGLDLASATSRRVLIETRVGNRWQPRRSNGWADDDRGFNLLNMLWQPEEESQASPRRRWSSIWIAPLVADITGDKPVGGELRFRVEHAGGTVCSASFRWPNAAIDNLMEEADCDYP